MRYARIHFHQFPGHEHGRGHDHCHHEAGAVKPTKEETIALLEHLHRLNEERCEELAEYRDGVESQAASGLLAESTLFLRRSNAKLGDAIAAYKRGG